MWLKVVKSGWHKYIEADTDDFMTISYDKSLVQILNWTITETDAQQIIFIRFLRYLEQIILFYTWTHWNLIRFLSLKLRKLFLDNFA